MSGIAVAITDDQPLIRAGLQMLVDSQSDLRFAGEAADGAEAITLARARQPDIMLLDIRMPGLDGIRAIGAILSVSPATRVLMLTTFDVDGYERDVLATIAHGLSNLEIAERLHISESTVKTHVSSILVKLGLRDRVQAVIAAYELGLVQAGRPDSEVSQRRRAIRRSRPRTATRPAHRRRGRRARCHRRG
jgi:DNA-binding NarL/FixJ family response regulator